MLKDYGVSPLLAWDRNAKNLQGSVAIDNLSEPVYDYKDKQIPIIVSVSVKQMYEAIRKELLMHGFENIHWIRDIENNQLCAYTDTKSAKNCNNCVVNRGGCRKYIDYLQKGSSSILSMVEMGILLTYRCSLSCKYCIQKCYKLKQKNSLMDADAYKLEAAISNMVSAVGWLRQVNILGGEIFLYKDWAKIVRSCIANENIGIVHILTNGVCRIDEVDIPLLQHEKIVVELDNYGEKIPEHKKKLFDTTKSLFDSKGINYSVINNTAGTWYDFGEFEKRGSSIDELKARYSACPGAGCMTLDPEGCFSICGRQSIADLLGENIYIKGYEKIDVLKHTVEELREVLGELLAKDYLEICDYCNGATRIVPAGEQHVRQTSDN